MKIITNFTPSHSHLLDCSVLMVALIKPDILYLVLTAADKGAGTTFSQGDSKIIIILTSGRHIEPPTTFVILFLFQYFCENSNYPD